MPGEGAKDPDNQAQDEKPIDAGHGPVSKLNEGLNTGGLRKYFSITERPVIPAAGPRAGSPHVGAPKDHRDIPGQDDPGEARQFCVQALLYYRERCSAAQARFGLALFVSNPGVPHTRNQIADRRRRDWRRAVHRVARYPSPEVPGGNATDESQ